MVPISYDCIAAPLIWRYVSYSAFASIACIPSKPPLGIIDRSFACITIG